MNYRIVHPILAPHSRPHDRETEAEYFQRLSDERRRADRHRRSAERRARLRTVFARGSRPHGRG